MSNIIAVLIATPIVLAVTIGLFAIYGWAICRAIDFTIKHLPGVD